MTLKLLHILDERGRGRMCGENNKDIRHVFEDCEKNLIVNSKQALNIEGKGIAYQRRIIVKIKRKLGYKNMNKYKVNL